MAILSGPPINDSLVELDPKDPQRTQPFYMAVSWIRWLIDTLIPAVQSAVLVKASLVLTGQHATMPATSLGVLTAGTYRVSYYTRVTTPDGVASTLTITLGWTESGLPLSVSGALLNGDTTATLQTGSALIVLDPSSTITIAAAYTSNTPAKMQFRLTTVAERVL